MDPVKRSIFCQELNIIKEEGKAIIYIDESGFAHDMPRTQGYSLKGHRCYGNHNWGSKGRTNVIGALMEDRLFAIGILTGSVNTAVFSIWVEESLLPNLPEKSVLVMDNAAFHKGGGMQKSIKDAGHTLLYLPPYSPDLNPIEQKWAQVKHKRRSTNCSIDELFNTHFP
jgi:transposase